MEMFIEPGDSVLIPEPTFSMYRFFSQVAGARIVSVRYDEAMNFPLEATLRELARSPHILFIANPNNPDGDAAGRGGAGADSGCRAAHTGSGGRSVFRIFRAHGAALDSPAAESGRLAHVLQSRGLGGAAPGRALRARRRDCGDAPGVYALSGELAGAGRGRSGAERPEVSARLHRRGAAKAAISWREGSSNWGRAFFPAAPISCWPISGRAARDW